MTPARFRWGMLLILIGTLWFLASTDIFNVNFLIDLAIFLPVLLIAIGIEKIFTKTKLEAVAYLTTIAFVGAAFYIAVTGSSGGDRSSFFSEYEEIIQMEDGIEAIQARIELDNTDLTIRDATEYLAYGRFNEFTRKPDFEYTRSGDDAVLTVESRSGGILGGRVKIDTDRPQDWYLSFNDRTPLDLECIGNEADMHLNLATTPLHRLDVTAERASVYVKVGDLRETVTLNLGGESSSIRLRVPVNAGLAVFGSEYGSYLEQLGLIERDSAFVSDGFDTLSPRIEVRLGDRLDHLSIDFF